jgi:rhodanese-related sulfurtransferase
MIAALGRHLSVIRSHTGAARRDFTPHRTPAAGPAVRRMATVARCRRVVTMVDMDARRTVHDMLAAARSRYTRVDAVRARDAVAGGALLVDVRDGDQRRRDGVISGALVIDRTVLEWRVDPDSGATHPRITSLDQPLILICNQGYSSSLAVASLLDLGVTNVTDVVGGFQAWRAAGLPIEPPAAFGGDESR